MKRLTTATALTLFIMVCLPFAIPAADSTYDTYKERFAIDMPGVGPVWIGIRQMDGYVKADMLWSGGSVLPQSYAGKVNLGDISGYVVGRQFEVVRERDANRKPVLVDVGQDSIVLNVTGNYVEGIAYILPRDDNDTIKTIEFSGKKIADVPAAPDLSSIKYGEPIELFNGKDLTGWKLVNGNDTNGWSVEDGVLHNKPKQTQGQPHISYGNLRTEAEYEDFNIKLEVNVPKNGNSGVYLKGIYEVQVADTHGKPLDSHNMGGIYSRITPSENAEKPAGEWQTLDITLKDRHATVILNGKTIIDNKPILGCTGGALTANEFKAGPIYLQGDHDFVSYRNVILTPVVE